LNFLGIKVGLLLNEDYLNCTGSYQQQPKTADIYGCWPVAASSSVLHWGFSVEKQLRMHTTWCIQIRFKYGGDTKQFKNVLLSFLTAWISCLAQF
jgi:hypothetical protein